MPTLNGGAWGLLYNPCQVSWSGGAGFRTSTVVQLYKGKMQNLTPLQSPHHPESEVENQPSICAQLHGKLHEPLTFGSGNGFSSTHAARILNPLDAQPILTTGIGSCRLFN